MPRILNPKNYIKLSNNFITVLTCSSRKQQDSKLVYNHNGELELIELNATVGLRPNDLAFDDVFTWREIVENNQDNGNIPFMAYELYVREEYTLLRDALGDRFFIQSAGFGIIRSDFRLPKYNITFGGANELNRRYYNPNENDGYNDFNQLPVNDEDILYVGGQTYLPQFIELTRDLPNRKIIFYSTNQIPQNNINDGENFVFKQYTPMNPNQRTNWHYGLARDIANGFINM